MCLRTLVVSVSLLALLSCSPRTLKGPDSPAGSAAKGGSRAAKALPLKQEEAQIRARQVEAVNYVMWFGLDDAGEEYDGRTVVRFNLKDQAAKASNHTFIDFEGGKITGISINGVAWPAHRIAERYDGNRLQLEIQELKSGENQVRISFSRAYSKTGNGLHRFKDPVDGRVYLYTNFEPYSARRMWPCFDQPDLKATYELTVETPDDWEVIANTEERDITKVDGRRSWQFPPTQVFSTYIFALHAGPYSKWKEDAAGIPMRLFARRSLAKHMDSKEWFEVTRQGLAFFNKKFDYPYPYSKYDQIIVPDFNAGAMENVAAVTFSERFIYRSKVTDDTRQRRANVILHEMAHMWFGDLVTMRWWNGLWLNESFATFIATWAVDNATRFKTAWPSFFGTKTWAYWEDQLVTTHPIEGTVTDTDAAFAHFDGITYGKGAAALKQLMFFIGEEAFLKGLRIYFKEHAGANTEIEDFLRALTAGSGQDLAAWQKAWLRTSGVNTLEASWECEGGKIARFSLLQGKGNGDAILRPHRTQIALYSKSAGGSLKATEVLPITYAEAETPVPSALGKACPVFVYPNHGDQDYVRVRLDPKSLVTARASLAEISDAFPRQMLWNDLWEMVRDAQLSARDYLEIVFAQGLKEKDTQTLARVLASLNRASDPTSSAIGYIAPGRRGDLPARVEAFLAKVLDSAKAGSDLQLIAFQSWVDAARSEAGLKRLAALLDGKTKIPGMKIDQERRWELLRALSAAGDPGAQTRVLAELKKDATDTGLKEAIRAQAGSPDAALKEAWLTRLLKKPEPAASAAPRGILPAPEGGAFKYAQLREAMRSFHKAGQEELSRKHTDSYFSELPRLVADEDEDYVGSFAGSMFPPLCSPEAVTKATRVLKDNPGFPTAVLKDLRIGIQETERCMKARAAAI